MFDMSKNIDVYVCMPDAGINKALSGVFIQFEIMDPGKMEGTGKPHTVAMTTSDAMWLLRHLENLQQRFSLEKQSGEITELKGKH
jgi:hypothetical protein